MSNLTKLIALRQIQTLKCAVLQLPDLPFSNILTNKSLQQIIDHSESSRDRIFTPLVTLKAFIFQVLGTDGSCRQAVMHVLSERLQQGKKAISVMTGAYCMARQRLPYESLKALTEETGKKLHQKADSSWKWKGHNTLLTDGTTVLMPDTKKNQHDFPQQGNQKPGLGFPIARIVGLVSLSVGTVVSYAVGPYQGKGTGETSLFSQLIDAIAKNDLLLADRYYCTWAILALMMQKRSHLLVQNHAQRKPDFRCGKKLGAKDHLVEWKKPKRKPDWISQADYKALPEYILIREFAVKGMIFVTTLLDAKKYSKKELAKLYLERWKIELDIRSIKTQMGMEMLRCKSPEMVKKEIAVHFLSYNLIRATIARAAKTNQKTPRKISFMTAVQSLNEGISGLLFLSGKVLKYVVKTLLTAISSVPIGMQKRKKQPRAIKRRPKPYPLLTKPRSEYS